MPVPLTHVEATLLVPVGDAFLGVLAEVRMSRASRDLRPRRRVVEHDFHFLRGLGKLGVDGGRERVAVELSAESARALIRKIEAALAAGEEAHAA